MTNEKLYIDELILRVPGVGEQEAHWIGLGVAKCITDSLPLQHRDRHSGTHNYNISVPAGTSEGQIVRLISGVILKGLV